METKERLEILEKIESLVGMMFAFSDVVKNECTLHIEVFREYSFDEMWGEIDRIKEIVEKPFRKHIREEG